jgi:hypothetical protein
VLVSTDPAGGPRSWKLSEIDPGNELTGVSCASADQCVAVDNLGNVLLGTWTAHHAA